jgi:hypothetical protein
VPACELVVGDSYCVQENYGNDVTSTSVVATPVQSTVGTPTPYQTGMVDNCNDFYLARSSDTCNSIATNCNITSAELVAWNPAVGSDCLDLEAKEYLCIGTGVITAIHPAPTSTPPVSKTSTSSSITSTIALVTPTPVQVSLLQSSE